MAQIARDTPVSGSGCYKAGYTSAAPYYYPGVLDAGYVMLDGGLWANTPVMNALVDALACFDVAREDI